MSGERSTGPLVDRYEELIRDGVYSASFVHGPGERRLVADVLAPILRDLGAERTPVRVLDAGCGPGAWLEEVGRIASEEDVAIAAHGFDITPSMVEVAARRLAPSDAGVDLKVGDVLDPDSYRFGATAAFDLVFSFDVVQQLPRRLQLTAIETMLGAVGDGGTLVVFDHDRTSPYGRRMGLKKWLTRHTPLKLVPSYYTESAYPPLAAFAARLRGSGREVGLRTTPASPKRALVVRRTQPSV